MVMVMVMVMVKSGTCSAHLPQVRWCLDCLLCVMCDVMYNGDGKK